MLIAVINQSTMVNNIDVNTMCQAIQIQLSLHVLPAYNMKAATVTFYADKTKVPGYAWVISVLDNSTQAGALGYHSEDNDKVDGYIFAQPVLSNAGVVLYDTNNPQNVSVASVLSHEICEMVGDRFANAWVDGPAIAQGSEYAQELCDPVEGDSYAITVNGAKVSVSNFIFPSWFNPEATTVNLPFDYLGKLKAPFTMTPGGYMIVRQSGTVSQVFGEEMPEWKREVKRAKAAKRPSKTRKKFLGIF
jgi:hypothetical protein